MILAEAPAGAKVLDLGALRAARDEVRAKEGATVAVIKLSAGFVELAAEIPLEAAIAFEAGDVRGGLAGMLKDPTDVGELLAAGLTAQDIAELATFLNTNLGESLASA